MSSPLPVLSDLLESHSGSRRPAGLPRLLDGISPHGATSLAEHLAVHGPLQLARKRSRGAEHPLVGQIERAGLRGRGGAGFPTATKMRAVAASRGRAVVVVNAAEGEPASLKDRTLTRTLPHLVLDGAALAAHALGAEEIVVGVCEAARGSVESIAAAIAERGSPRRGSPRTRLRTVPTHYVAGQESALVNHLSGAPAIPSFTPPMPFQQGVARRPTLVSNAETLAHIALIARHGPDWFRELGTPSEPGSMLVTLSGPVAHPGVYEIEYGASLASLIHAAGGTTARPRAALMGGYGGSWIGEAHLDGLVLSDERLAACGASLGAGVVLLLSEDACPVAEATRVARWLAGQSTGQCGPCVYGLDALASSLQEIAGGVAGSQPTQRIARLAALVRRRGACGHPDGTVRLILSAIDAFGPELADHARHGPCEGCLSPGELPLPTTSAASRRATPKPVRPR
ncbi:MAG: NADH-ubiquinone oxidoreductase-F iron-sulfur binding region domain-containing protein [Solirubrobacteraceae bacterium]